MIKSAQNLEISHSTPWTLLLERLKAGTGTMAGAPVSCRLNVRERENSFNTTEAKMLPT
jgi:hypothetical protein